MLLSFLPFVMFAVLTRIVPLPWALAAAAALALMTTLRDVRTGREVKMLDGGAVVLFAGLGVATGVTSLDLSVLQVRVIVDVGLLAIVVLSILRRRPFTLPYARERTPEMFWTTPRFLAINLTISSVWAAAIGLSLAIELALLEWPALPTGVGVLAIAGALIGAGWFSGWYARRARPIARG